jgi:8-oxo-dGTP diphosphatase
MIETGLKIDGIRHVAFTNDVFQAEMKHYVTLFVTANCQTGEPSIQEPEKCGEWAWFKWSELPTPLFLPLQNLIESNFAPFDNVEQSY